MSIASALAANTTAQMKHTPATDNSGATGIMRATRLGAERLSNTPSITGMITTWRVCLNRSQVSTGTMEPTSNWVSNGVKMIAAMVEQTVITTESATSAPAM